MTFMVCPLAGPRPATDHVPIEVIASNLGGTATLMGDPPNIMIAGHTGLSFNAFIVNLGADRLRAEDRGRDPLCCLWC